MKSITVALFAIMLTLIHVNVFANKENFIMPEKKQTSENPIIIFKTSVGDIKVELFPEKAPKTVENFIKYVNNGHYADTIFHRVIDGFMIQGGGFTADFKQKPTDSGIENEASNGLSNERGTIAMARTQAVNSATAQFFINVADNHFLDHRGKSPHEFGYCVFGQVISGMDVVDKIKGVKTGTHGPHSDVPVNPIIIKAAEIAKAPTS